MLVSSIAFYTFKLDPSFSFLATYMTRLENILEAKFDYV